MRPVRLLVQVDSWTTRRVWAWKSQVTSAVPSSGTASFVGKLGAIHVSPSGDASMASADVRVQADFGNRSLGFELGVQSPPNATGPLGAYLAACPSLATALGELAAFYPLVSWDGSRLWGTPQGASDVNPY